MLNNQVRDKVQFRGRKIKEKVSVVTLCVLVQSFVRTLGLLGGLEEKLIRASRARKGLINVAPTDGGEKGSKKGVIPFLGRKRRRRKESF